MRPKYCDGIDLQLYVIKWRKQHSETQKYRFRLLVKLSLAMLSAKDDLSADVTCTCTIFNTYITV